MSQRTVTINQIRAFLLARGVAVRRGLRFLRAELLRALAMPDHVLSLRIVRIIEELAEDWRRLDDGSITCRTRSQLLRGRMLGAGGW